MATVHLIFKVGNEESEKSTDSLESKLSKYRYIPPDELFAVVKRGKELISDQTKWIQLSIIIYLDDEADVDGNRDGNPLGYHLDYDFLQFFEEVCGDLKRAIDVDIYNCGG